MEDIILAKMGRGLFPTDVISEEEVASIKNGECVAVTIKHERSKAQHDFLFALCKAAFVVWPANHEFQPASPEHLRKWLLHMVGHCDIATFIENEAIINDPVMDGMTIDQRLGVIRMMRAQKAWFASVFHDAFAVERKKGAYVWCIQNGDGSVEIRRPQSIARKNLKEEKFKPIVRAVVELVESTTGCSVDDMCPDTKAAQYFNALKKYREAA